MNGSTSNPPELTHTSVPIAQSEVHVRLRDVPHFLKAVFVEGLDNAIPDKGAALAFYAMLSLVPLFLFLLSATSAVFGNDRAQEHIHNLANQFAGENGAVAINNILQASSSVDGRGLAATIFNFGMLFFGASGVFTQLQEVLNAIWKTPAHKGALIWMVKQHFFSIAMVFGAGLLLIAAIVTGTVLTTAIHFATSYMPVFGHLAQIFTLLMNFTIIAFVFALTYKMIPDLPVRWGDVWLGAVFAALLFTLGQYLIGFYLAHTGLVAEYGPSGSLVAFLVWIYYSAQIYFFGAQLTKIYAHTYGSYHVTTAR